MAFPEDPLGLRVEIQPGGSWTDITGRCKTSAPIVHARGIRNKGTAVAEPASVPLMIDNKDGVFSPRNPMSPYDLTVNTPVRLWLPGGTHFLDLDGSDTSYASTPDHAALDITGDLDLRWEGEANWYGPGARMLLGKWGDSGQRSYHMRIQDGSLYLSGITNLGESYFVSRPLPALPERAALRVTLDADNGAGGWSVAHYWAPTIAGPWTQINSTFTAAGTITTFVSTAPLLIAPAQPTATVPRRVVDGKVYKAEVRSGIGGTLVASPDFTARPLGTAGFTDSAGRVWSYSGTAAVADRQELFVGEISNWPQRWTPASKTIWTPVTAAGILRRLSQGKKPLDSTLRRRVPSGNPIAYWPFEEDNLASRAYSPISGVTPAAVTGVEWAAVDTLPSSKALPRLTAAATLSAIVPDAADGQWQVELVYNADDKAPPTAGERAEFLSISTTGTVRRWLIRMRKDSIAVTGYNASGTDIINTAVTATEDIFHGWFRLRLYAQDLGGGQMEWVIGWTNVNGGILQLPKTITGSPGHVTAVTANWGPLTEGWSIGHLSVMPTAANTIYDGSDSAYSGETAWVRMRRLAGEEGLPMARIPGDLPVERVGPQRVAKLTELLQAAADADDGMLLEDRRRLGLVYRDRSSMYTQDPALTLTYGLPGLAPPLEPDDEADVYRNDRTVQRDGGSEARAVLETGRLSVQDPPAGIGLYDDSVTLSLADDVQAEPIAWWRLYHGTFDAARYPTVTVKLHRAPHLIPQVLAMREGDIIRLKSLPGHVAYGDLDLLVTGWTETLLPRTWVRTFTCEPGAPWDLANVNVIHENFEDGVYDVTITNSGTLPWTRTSAQFHSGSNSLRSGAIANNQTSDAVVSVPVGATSFSFWYRTSSEASGPGFEGDRLLVLVDGVQVLRAQGATGWTKATLDVTGKSVVLFRYAKDNSAASGEDAVYIDDLRIIVGTYQPTKAGTDGSQLTAGIDADDLTLSVAVTAGPLWTTDANEMPIRIDVGGAQVIVPPGVYLIGATLRIYNNTRLTLMAGAEFRRNVAATMIINGDASQTFGGYTGHSRIVIEGGLWNMRGTTAGLTASAMCISIGHATDIVIRDLEVRDLPGFHAVEMNSTSHGLIENCKFRGYVDPGGRDFSEAIQLDLAKSSSVFGGFGPYDHTPTEDVLIIGCHFGASGTAGTTAWPRGVGSHSATITKWHRRIRVIGNSFEGILQYAVSAYNWEDATIVGNTFLSCGSGVRVRSVIVSDPEDTKLPDGTPTGASQSLRNITISGNSFRGGLAYDEPIICLGETTGTILNVAITGNTIDGSTSGQNGIRLQECSRVAVGDNIISNVAGTGISTEDCNTLTVTGNNIFACASHGITIVDNSNSNVVGNQVREPGENGILVQSSSFVHLRDNFIRSPSRTTNAASYGIRLSTTADSINVSGNKVRPHGSGNEAAYAFSATNTVTTLSRYGNDWRGTYATGQLNDLSITPNTTATDIT